jgi:hypothetical protein
MIVSPSAGAPEPAVAPAVIEIAQLLRQVEEQRGLRAVQLPELEALTTSELTLRALSSLGKNTPPALRETYEQLLVRLELAPSGFRWLPAMERALRGRLRAFYDPERRSIVVDRSLVGASRQRALWHELVHALQDQHYGLGERLRAAPDAWDRQSALHSLAEGDAELLVSELSTLHAAAADPAWQDVSQLPPNADSEAPSLLLRALSAPYVDGRGFVARLHAGGGWAAVDARLATPPATTQQLLHPEQQGSTRPPLPIPEAPDSHWQLTYTDLLGEQTLRTVLEGWTSELVAERVAAGWAADRLSSFGSGDGAALVWELRFERSADAHDAAAVIQAGMRWESTEMQTRVQAIGRSPFVCRTHRDGGVVGAVGAARRWWLLSLRQGSTEATCLMLREWGSRLLRSRTRRGDPGRDHLTGPS